MKRKRRTKRRPRRRNGVFEELIASNVHAALRDESHTLIARLVDETLKDPELRERIHELTRVILKGIAERI